MKKWVVGVDEAGRGPLAGPVAVGVVKVPSDFDWHLLSGVNDSKQLSERTREALFTKARQLKAEDKLDYAVAMVSAQVIDRIGISRAIAHAMARAMARLTLIPHACQVKLDGSLKAPAEFVYQETIIKGDSKEKVIALASIMAKVTRDRYMVNQAKKPNLAPYQLAVHKGYGTKAHRTAIKTHGLSALHRASYCKNIDKKQVK